MILLTELEYRNRGENQDSSSYISDKQEEEEKENQGSKLTDSMYIFQVKDIQLFEVLLNSHINRTKIIRDNFHRKDYSGHKDIEMSILKSNLFIKVYKSPYKNHPLHTDTRISVVIPYLHIHIDDNLILLIEVLKMTLNTSSVDILNEDVQEANAEIGLDASASDNQRKKLLFYLIRTLFIGNVLIDKLRKLKEDHQEENKNCKHCILLHKKSKLLLNIFFGNIKDYIVKENDFFRDFTGTNNSFIYNDEATGIIITNKHSMVRDGLEQEANNIVYLPFIAITRDVGFFKDNIIIHCAENPEKVPMNQNSPADVTVRLIPEIKSDIQGMNDFDQNFWKYFLKVERSFKTVNQSKFEESFVETSNIKATSRMLSSNMKFYVSLDREVFDKPVYILYFRKENLHKDILKVFTVKGAKKSFQNLTVMRVQELSIHFDSMKSLNSIASVIYFVESI